jgi:hypothetical protein
MQVAEVFSHEVARPDDTPDRVWTSDTIDERFERMEHQIGRTVSLGVPDHHSLIEHNVIEGELILRVTTRRCDGFFSVWGKPHRQIYEAPKPFGRTARDHR